MYSIEPGRKVAVIAGAGPAGLTAALELVRRTDILPWVVELDQQVGGISKTVNYRGNRMDLGGHRFFSKSDWVMKWWQDILPIALDESEQDPLTINYQQQSRTFKPALNAGAGAGAGQVMLVRRRLSRIFYRRRFFDYPLKLNLNTVRNMGILETGKIGLSYASAKLSRREPEVSLEDFLVNRFGERLYQTFFKDYTEKVWGVPCAEISAEWGAQRIKGLSVTKAVAHAVLSPFRSNTDAAQKATETSLIERFLYPRLGPGQMWEEVARRVQADGGKVSLGCKVVGLHRRGMTIQGVDVRFTDGVVQQVPCDHFISTMPVKDLAGLLQPEDDHVLAVASRLPYRDFMTAGLLLKRMRSPAGQAALCADNGMPPDNWIYIQESDVKVGRLQIFNNWSPALVQDPQTIWLGLEYFCTEGDELWGMPDGRFLQFAASELQRLGLIDLADVLDGTVVRVPKAYPAYFGEYRDFDRVRAYLDRFTNLYPVGRNGMHRYNNQDHSMLAAESAVSAIINGGQGKSAIWDINAEEEYHEEVQATKAVA